MRVYLVTALCFAAAATATAQRAEFDTPTAIAGATVVTEPGHTIEDATVVIQDGQIKAVGANVDVPDDAAVLDGTGLYVYPAFIDAVSHMGMPEGAPPADDRNRIADEERDQRRAPRTAMQHANRKGVWPHWNTAIAYKPDNGKREAYRKAGFGAALVAPHPAILSGAGDVLQLNNAHQRSATIARIVAHTASLDSFSDDAYARNSYPSSAMGASALLRQTFMDAEWYADHKRLADRGARDVGPAPADPVLDAVLAIRNEKRPVLFVANTAGEIHHTLDRAAELGVTPVILGGAEAWRVVDRLKRTNTPVILTLDWDEKPKRAPKKPKDKADPEYAEWDKTISWDKTWEDDFYEPRRVRDERIRLWEEQVKNLHTLREAGIKTAVTTSALKEPGNVHEKLREAIELGLPVDDALAVLTMDAARLLGVSDRLGSIDKGKLANLTVTSGPIDDKESVVRHVFIEGERFDTGAVPKKKDDGKKEEESDSESEEEDSEEPKDEKAPSDKHPWSSEILADRDPGITTNGDVLIQGGRVITGTGETIEGGDVLIVNGKIRDVGMNLRAPGGVTTIDAAGYWVMPGIIDPHSHIAITGGVNEWSEVVTCEARISDVITTDQTAMYRALAGGVTTIHAMHGSANVIGGQNAVLKLKYRHAPSEVLIKDSPTLVKFALGENVIQANFDSVRGGRFPVTRMGVESTLRNAFNDAIAYQEELDNHRGGGLPPRRDVRLDALSAILEGDIWIHSHCYRADEILRLLAVAEEYGVRVATLQHVLEGYRILPEMVHHGAAGSTFSDWWAYKIEAADAVPHNAAMMLQAGVVSSINSDDPGVMRHLYLEASKSIRFGGLTAYEALRLITINPAIQLGIDDRTGTIEKGKDGDIAIFTHHPFDVRTCCMMTLIDGEVFFKCEYFSPGKGPDSSYVPQPPRELIETPATANVYAITGATVHPMSGPAIENGTVVIRDGKIEAVGAGIATPSGANVIDAAGLHVYPGLINAGSTLGLIEIPRLNSTNDSREIGYLQPDLQAAAAVNPHSVHIPITRAEGVTTTLAVPLAGAIPGQAGLVDLDGWTYPELRRADSVALVVSLPTLPTEIDDERDKKVKEHQEEIAEIEDYFREAQLFAKTRGDEDPGESVDDLRLAAMVPYVRGENPVMFMADSYKAILGALKFAEAFELKPIILGGREAWKCTEKLKAQNAAVVLTSVFDNPSHPFERYDAAFACAAKLHDAGVPIAFGYADGSMAKLLPVEAGISTAFGLSEEAAIRALTIGAAEILGVNNSIGSLEAGKTADVIITTGSPIQPSTRTVASFIDGRPVTLDSQHETDYQRFNNRPAPDLGPAPTGLNGPPPMRTR